MIFHSHASKTQFALSLVMKVRVLDLAVLWPILGQSWENGDKVPKPFLNSFVLLCMVHLEFTWNRRNSYSRVA